MTVHVEPRVLIAQHTLPAVDVRQRSGFFESALDGIRAGMERRLKEERRTRLTGFETISIVYVELAQVSVGQDGRVDAVFTACQSHLATSAIVTVKWPLMPA